MDKQKTRSGFSVGDDFIAHDADEYCNVYFTGERLCQCVGEKISAFPSAVKEIFKPALRKVGLAGALMVPWGGHTSLVGAGFLALSIGNEILLGAKKIKSENRKLAQGLTGVALMFVGSVGAVSFGLHYQVRTIYFKNDAREVIAQRLMTEEVGATSGDAFYPTRLIGWEKKGITCEGTLMEAPHRVGDKTVYTVQYRGACAKKDGKPIHYVLTSAPR